MNKKLKILFVYSGNYKSKINPIIKNQGDSLSRKGIIVEYFPIIGKGMMSYLKSILPLKRMILANDLDIVHAHYALSGFTSGLASSRPVVTSIMGSEIYEIKLVYFLIRLFSRFIWNETIVKSAKIKEDGNLQTASIIPNGVNLEKYAPINFELARQKLDFKPDIKYILFSSDPSRPEKDFQLAKKCVQQLNNIYRGKIELRVLKNIDNNDIPYYMNAADILLLTSKWEGSPNVIKEAMACNLPIVSTNVGDVKEIISNASNCFVCESDENKMAEKLKQILISENNRSNGREYIQNYSDTIIADKIIQLYKNLLKLK